MICKPCRKGGELNKSFVATGEVQDAKRAADWHYQCDHKCDCQHFVGKGIAGREPK